MTFHFSLPPTCASGGSRSSRRRTTLSSGRWRSSKSASCRIFLLVQIQKHLVFLFNVWHKLRPFSWNFQTSQGSQMFQTSYFVAGMDILCSKLEVCLPLAYPSTIYKHFSSLKPFKICSSVKLKIFLPALILFPLISEWALTSPVWISLPIEVRLVVSASKLSIVWNVFRHRYQLFKVNSSLHCYFYPIVFSQIAGNSCL